MVMWIQLDQPDGGLASGTRGGAQLTPPAASGESQLPKQKGTRRNRETELVEKRQETNPSGEGSLNGKNFLQSGYHIGINTVGQTLRNANQQLRSEPPNPQVKVSPWLQTTIEPDLGRKPMEIGGCA